MSAIMSDAEAQIAARSPEEQRLVRSFSIDEASGSEPGNIVHAVADYGEEARQREAARWRLQFQDQNAARPRDLDKLGVEVEELRKLMKSFPEAGNSGTWSYDDARNAVNESKRKWESKKRFFGGKAQKTYHDVMCNLDAHSGLLSIIPQSNTYVSVVTGAVKTIVKTSVNHRQTIEALTKGLKEINDEAAACMAECNLIQNETIQIAVAKFYIAVLLFYADVMKFYQASSGRKIWHSFDDKFSDRFKGPLENIKRLSRLVQRAAATGQGAEVRVIRLTVEEASVDIRAGLQGLARQQAELKESQTHLQFQQTQTNAQLERLNDPQMLKALSDELWRSAGMSGTALLLGQGQNMANERRAIEASDTQLQRQLPDIQANMLVSHAEVNEEIGDETETLSDILPILEHLLELITRGARTIDISTPSFVAFDERITTALEKWTRASDSTLLYVEGASFSPEARQPQVTVAASRIVSSADQLRLPLLSFFCSAVPSSDSSTSPSSEIAPPILGLVYSLMYQLASQLPPLTKISSLLPSEFLASLDETSASWMPALQAFTQMLTLAPPLLLCVIDSFHILEPQLGSETSTQKYTNELLDVLRGAMRIEGKIFKVLFSEPLRSFTLLEKVSDDEKVMIPGVRRSGGGGAPPGRRAFLPHMI